MKEHFGNEKIMFHRSSIFALLGVFHIRGPHRRRWRVVKKYLKFVDKQFRFLVTKRVKGAKIPESCGRHICKFPKEKTISDAAET